MNLFTKKEILPIILIIAIFTIGFLLYPKLPERIPSHWNAQGKIDSWSGKNFTIFFFPCLILGLYLLMIFLPLIDPLRENYRKFSQPYFYFRLLLVVFLGAIYLYTLLAGLGWQFNIIYFVLPLFSILFILLGLFLPKIKKNYFVGIRTPWTIHSEEVWDKTHQFSGKIFIAAGLIGLIGFLIPSYAFLIFIISVMAAALISIIYSYFVFRKLEN